MNGFRTARRISLLGLAASCLVFAANPAAYELPANSSRAQGWVLADLNGDRTADLAAAGPGLRDGRDYLHRVNIDLTGSQATSFMVRGASPSISLTFRDIDGDHDRDLVILEPWSLRPIGIWLNDGHGNFNEGDVADYSAIFGKPDSRSFGSSGEQANTSFALHNERSPAATLASETYVLCQPTTLTLPERAARPILFVRTGAQPRAPPALA